MSQTENTEDKIPTIDGVTVKLVKSGEITKLFNYIATQEGCKVIYLTELEKIKSNVKINGFRGGRVPSSYIEQTYDRQLIEATINEIVNMVVSDTLKENPSYELNSKPEVLNHDIEKATVQNWKDETFSLTFDVLFELVPQVGKVDLKSIKITSPDVDLTEEELTKELEDLAQKYAELEDTQDGHAIQDGNVVKINFTGTIDDVEFEGGSAEDHSLKIGSNTFIDTFEKQLIGLKVGEEKTVAVNFPDSYPNNKELEGKPAKFHVKINQIQEVNKDSVALNDQLAKKVSFESLDKLKEDIKLKTNKFYKNAHKDICKNSVFTKLASLLNFSLPESSEKSMQDSFLSRKKLSAFKKQNPDNKTQPTEEDLSKIEVSDADNATIKTLVQEKLKTSYFLMRFAAEHKVSLTEADIEDFIITTASNMNINPSSVFEFYKSNPSYMERMKSTILEFKIFDRLFLELDIDYSSYSKEDAITFLKEEKAKEEKSNNELEFFGESSDALV